MLFFVYIVFFEQWIYMKSEEMVKYFVYIQGKGTFWFCGMSIWVIYTGWDGDWDGETPDSGIRMVCYQVWCRYEIGCRALAIGMSGRCDGW